MISAVLALVLCLMLMPAGVVNAAEVQTGGYENGNGLDLNKIGSYVSGISNPNGGVAEIVSYDVVENKVWVVNGATGMNLSVSDNRILNTLLYTAFLISNGWPTMPWLLPRRRWKWRKRRSSSPSRQRASWLCWSRPCWIL